MTKKSIFSRIRDAATKASQRIQKIWKKEEKPLPETKAEKKSWIKDKFSIVKEYSPWNLFRSKRIKELEAEIEVLKGERKEPKAEPFEEVLPSPVIPEEKKPVKLLINDEEFESERFRMLGVMRTLEEQLTRFADGYPYVYEKKTWHPPKTEIEVDTAALADGSVIVQAKFAGWEDDYEEFNRFTLMLEQYMHSIGLGIGYRVSIANQWDPSKIPVDVKMDLEEQKAVIKGSDFDLHKGLIDVAQNVSIDLSKSFVTARKYLGPELTEMFGSVPDHLTIRIVWGESVVRIGRKSVKI